MTDTIKKGDIFTISGQHKRRTFWEWLARKPKELQRFVVTSEVTAGGIVEYKDADHPGLMVGYGGPKAFEDTTLSLLMTNQKERPGETKDH